MPELLIIADDITGALDTGVQLSKNHIRTRILLDPFRESWDAYPDPVLVLAPATRQLSPADAYRAIADIASLARDLSVPYVYKKTDSALRGNIGAELQAIADAYPAEPVCFVPAFPAAGRITRDGVHYIGGIPVADSVFGRDPFSPVTESYIPAWLREKGLVNATRLIADHSIPSDAAGGEVLVFDAVQDGDLQRISGAIRRANLRLLAGCAGFAGQLPDLIPLRQDAREESSREDHQIPGPTLTVFSGSLNPITLAQIHYAADRGFSSVPIPNTVLSDAMLSDAALDGAQYDGCTQEGGQSATEKLVPITDSLSMETPPFTIYFPEAAVPLDPAIQTPGGLSQDAKETASRLGLLASTLYKHHPSRLWMIVGGDTLQAFLRFMGLESLTPLHEIGPGVVLARGDPGGVVFVTKSGGLGSVDVFIKVRQYAASATCMNPKK